MQTLAHRVHRAAGSNGVRVWLLAGACLGLNQARADDILWGNTSGGVFSTGTNWIGGVVPGASDSATFARSRSRDQIFSYTVSFSTDPTIQSFLVGPDRVTLDLNGRALLLSSATTAITVGTSQTASGVLTILDGVVATTGVNSLAVIGTNNVPGLLTISTGGQLLGPRVVVGYGGTGSLIVQNGGDLVGRQMWVGSPTFPGLPVVRGTATVTGAGSNVVVEGLTVGSAGPGTLSILSGGGVESTAGIVGETTGTIGTVNVVGVNSRWTSSGSVTVGDLGQGTLNITGGGRVTCASDVVLGGETSGIGTAEVNGVNSLWTCTDNMWVGDHGQGVLNITGGGRVESSMGVAASGSESTATITIAGNSQWISGRMLNVGVSGRCTMNVTGGSLVQCVMGTISAAFGTNVVNIDGAGSRWINASELTVGAFGNGTLNISAGGEVQCFDSAIASRGGRSSVNLSGAGSRWITTRFLSAGGDINNAGPVGGNATITIGAGGFVSASSLFMYPFCSVLLDGGTLDVGTIAHVVSPSGDLIFSTGVLHARNVVLSLQNQGGTLAPGRSLEQSLGSTSITGTYTQQAGATLEIEVGGTLPGEQFDIVSVGGTASLAGTLDLRLVNGFVPSPNHRFFILQAASIAGSFTNVANGQRLAVTGGGGSFVVHYGPGSRFDPTQVVLSEFESCQADFNGDGFLDFFDYIDFVTAFESGSGLEADFNSDGFVDFFDYSDFVAAFEAGC